MNSLIPYPGGKHYARYIIASRLPLLTTELVSPFVGGGSVEMHLARRGVRVHASDISGPLADLWAHALRDPGEIARLVERDYMPPSAERYRRALERMERQDGSPEAAAGAYAAYRMAFNSAVGGWAGFSASRKRLTLLQLRDLRKLRLPNLTVCRMDWQEALELRPETAAYLDPPYPFRSRQLYPGQKKFDWEKLADFLQDRKAPWLLSMPDHPRVRERFAHARVETVSWRQPMGERNRKNGAQAELLVSNY